MVGDWFYMIPATGMSKDGKRIQHAAEIVLHPNNTMNEIREALANFGKQQSI